MKLYLTLLFTGMLALAGCDNEGPAEEAGEEIDDTVEDAGDAVDNG